MSTPRQLAANRMNAQKSTGPKTEAGKERSSRNALVHGLSGAGAVLPCDEAAEIEGRKKSWRLEFSPNKGQQEWWYTQLVTHSVRVERCQRHEQALRDDLARRASTTWETDRTHEVERLAARLPKKPGLVSSRLRTTRHGCLWLIGQWLALGAVLEQADGWDDEHRALAFDLLGTSPLFRQGDPWPADGDASALVEEEVRALDALLADALDLQDEENRKAAEVGIELEVPPALALTRRYEAACTRQMEFARARLAELQETRPSQQDREIFVTGGELPGSQFAPLPGLRVELLDDPTGDDLFRPLGFETPKGSAMLAGRRTAMSVT